MELATFLKTLSEPFCIPRYRAIIQTGVQCFIQELQSKRREINLIGPNEDIEEHVEDCLISLDYFYTHTKAELTKRSQLLQHKQVDTISPCIDLGTGAGFPGILLALCFFVCGMPLHWYLIEKSPKKCIFLQSTIAKINKVLASKLLITIVNKNIYDEKIITDTMFFPYFVTARAFRPLTQQLITAIHRIVVPTSFVHTKTSVTPLPVSLFLYKGKKINIEKELQRILDNSSPSSVSKNRTPVFRVSVKNIIPLYCTHRKERHLLHLQLKQ